MCAKSLRRTDLPIVEEWFIDGDFSLEGGRRAAERWLAMADRPTAIFCASDEIALGFIAAINEEGLSVPRHVSVIGFDDIAISRHFIPALTTIRQPRHELGSRTAQRMLDRLDDAKVSPAGSERLPVELIVRATTGRPPSTSS